MYTRVCNNVLEGACRARAKNMGASSFVAVHHLGENHCERRAQLPSLVVDHVFESSLENAVCRGYGPEEVHDFGGVVSVVDRRAVVFQKRPKDEHRDKHAWHGKAVLRGVGEAYSGEKANCVLRGNGSLGRSHPRFESWNNCERRWCTNFWEASASIPDHVKCALTAGDGVKVTKVYPEGNVSQVVKHFARDGRGGAVPSVVMVIAPRIEGALQPKPAAIKAVVEARRGLAVVGGG